MRPRSIVPAAAAVAAAALLAAPLVAQAPVTLKTTEIGRGPTVVLVPGLGGTRTQWLPTARKLMADHRVVMVDLPGHGDSGLPDPFSLEAAAALLDQVIARHKPESTIVIGHGVGGVLAVLAARQAPEHVRGLAVIDAGLKTPFSAIPDQQRKYFLDYISEQPNYDAFVKQMFRSLGRDSAQGVEIHSRAALVPATSIRAYLRELMYMDYSAAAKQLTTPMLYIGSSRAWPDTTQWAAVSRERGLEGVAHLRSMRVADSGYLIMSDQPDSLAAAIAAFGREVLAAR